MLTTVRGVYRDGKIELEKPPRNVQNDSPVIVTFLEADQVDLRKRGIDKPVNPLKNCLADQS